MASGQSGYHVSSLKPNEVSANLRAGTFALRWPDEPGKTVIPIAYHLYVDVKGFYLICLNKITKEIECLDIALIHDTRTGAEVSLPRGANECEQMNIGALDCGLSTKWLTICYGNTYVADQNLRTIHFAFSSPAITKEFAEQLFHYGHNPLLRNLSGLECLEKIHARIVHGLVEDRFDKRAIPVRSLLRFLCKNVRDLEKETKIFKVLELLELPYKNDAVIDPDQLTFDKFVRFYMQLMERNEIDKLFDITKSEINVNEGVKAILPGGKHRRYIGWEKLSSFIAQQNDVRSGDAFGMDYYNQKAQDLIKKYTQHDQQFSQKGMCDEAFLRYLLSFDNLIVDPAKFDLFMDMDKPLAHYFIASSHNTYLTGSQLTGRASTEMYRQVLLTGCRCIELDVVDAEKNDEPEIKHKNTPVRPVLFVEVIKAIQQCAFKASPYPLVLSLENHCNSRAQAKMAEYLLDILGDSLITQPLKTHPCKMNCQLPSPNDLKYKILIKNKKLHRSPTNVNNNNVNAVRASPIRKTDSVTTTASEQSNGIHTTSTSPTPSSYSGPSTDSLRRKPPNDVREVLQELEFEPQLASDNNRNGVLIEGDYYSSDEDETPSTPVNCLDNESVEVTTTNSSAVIINDVTFNPNTDVVVESKATKAMSDLVHYVVPFRFITFLEAEKRNRSYEISSFNEDKAQSLIKENAVDFVAYNKRQLCRIYPRGTRFDSSNYNPYLYWPIGCQMVALNYQTLDTWMQVNLGLFSFNGGCGYLEKPASLCQSTGLFNPYSRTNVENVVGLEIGIKVISGQFLCQDREPTHVDIEMYGMYADTTKRREYRLRAKRWNGFQAVYDDTDLELTEQPVRFSKVILPEMASLRFAVTEEDGTFIGQGFLPVAHLRSGYRHVVLRNQMNIPVQSSTLFIFIRKEVQIDKEKADIAKILETPTSAMLPKTFINNESNSKQSRIFKPHQILSTQRSRSAGDLHKIETGMVIFENQQDHYTSNTNIHSTTDGSVRANKKRHPSSPVGDPNWLYNQLIDNSQLHDKNNLCKQLSLYDIRQTKSYKREREKIIAHVRRASVEYDKKIQIEEDRFQKCIYRQYLEQQRQLSQPNNGIFSPLERTPRHMSNAESTTMTTKQPFDYRKTSLTHQKTINEEGKTCEKRLLDLYSAKFHAQNEKELLHSKEFYTRLEKFVADYYEKQQTIVEDIFKQESAKVKEHVRVQTKSETKKIPMTETDRQKIANLKNKIRQMNIEAGAAAIRKLEEMHEQLKQTITTNLQTTLNCLQAERDLENKNRFAKYSTELDEIKARLQRQIYGMEYDTPRPNPSPMSTSPSFTAVSHQHRMHSPNFFSQTSSTSSSPKPRLSTTSVSNTDIASQATDDTLTYYLNEDTITTSL